MNITTTITAMASRPGSPASNITAGGHTLASRGARLSAASIDGAIALLIGLPALLSTASAVAAFVLFQEPFVWTPGMTTGFAVTSLLTLAWCVITWQLVARNGQTIGKKMVDIRVVRSDGSVASLGRIFWLRNVASLVPSLLPLLGLGYGLLDVLFIFNVKQQCLHDLIADTLVVRA